MMKNSVVQKHCSWIAMVVAVIILVCSTQGRAVWVGSEGEEWLHWNASTRAVYVRAYVQGIQHGFNKGCEGGIDAIQPQMKGTDVTKYTDACLSRFPLSDHDSMKYIESITAFYKKYPKQRFLYISDILFQLDAGRTVEQIHEHYPQGANGDTK